MLLRLASHRLGYSYSELEHHRHSSILTSHISSLSRLSVELMLELWDADLSSVGGIVQRASEGRTVYIRSNRLPLHTSLLSFSKDIIAPPIPSALCSQRSQGPNSWESKYGLWQPQDGSSHSNPSEDIDIVYPECDTWLREAFVLAKLHPSCGLTENIDM
jgi:hypothetical protein